MPKNFSMFFLLLRQFYFLCSHILIVVCETTMKMTQGIQHALYQLINTL